MTTKNKNNAQSGGLEHVLTYNEVHRSGFKTISKVAIGLTVLSLVLGVDDFRLRSQLGDRPVTYFAVTESGQMIKLAPLDRPYLTPENLSIFVTKAVTSVFTFDFVEANYRQQIQNARQYFDNAGWDSVMQSLADAKIIETVKKNRLVVSCAPTGAPVLVSKPHLEHGIYTENYQLPITVTYSGGGSAAHQNFIVDVKIQRQSVLDTKYGVAVTQLIAKSVS